MKLSEVAPKKQRLSEVTASRPKADPQPLGQKGLRLLDKAAQGATLGFADEFGALANSYPAKWVSPLLSHYRYFNHSRPNWIHAVYACSHCLGPNFPTT